MPFMKDLKRDLDEEGIKLLVNKEKNIEGFSNILDYLHKTFVHPSWPLSSLDDSFYNSDFNPPYSNFLNLNSSLHQLYVSYHTCYDNVICTQEGLFVNSYIDKPHYFVEMHFVLHECYSILPLSFGYWDKSNTSFTYQSRKEICTQWWLSRNGISKWKNHLLLLQIHINFPRFLPIFPDFLEWLSHLAPMYLLAPIIRNHQMLKFTLSPDPLTSWVPCVLQCASYLPHICLTDHTWRTALHMFTSWLTHAHCLPHLTLMVSFPSITRLYWYIRYPHVRLMDKSCSIAYRMI